ncbi:MAG: TolC family protein [Alistipes sp.]|nr:TolC family protein [Alistipes sp.]
MIRQLFICVVALLMSEVVVAQLSLEEYVSSVEEYSQSLAIARSQSRGAEADMRVAQRNFLPRLDLSSDVGYEFRDRSPQRQYDWGVRTTLSQPIFSGGRVRSSAKRAEMAYEAMLSRQESEWLSVRYDAEVAYWRLSRAETYLRAIEEYYAIVQTLREVASHRFEEGYTSKSDLLQVESRLSDAEYQLSLAEQQWRVALHGFNVLRGSDPSQDVTLYQSILDTMYMPQRECVMEVVASHPDYVSMVAQREAARWNVGVVQSNYLPNIGAEAYALWQPNTPHIKGAGTRLDGGLMLTLNTPIFHFGQRREAVRSARSAERVAELGMSQVADDIVLNESDGWTNLTLTQERVEATNRNLLIAEENLDISTYSYREGRSTILDVLQAQISWLQIYQNAISAQYDYAVAISAYRYIIADDIRLK